MLQKFMWQVKLMNNFFLIIGKSFIYNSLNNIIFLLRLNINIKHVYLLHYLNHHCFCVEQIVCSCLKKKKKQKKKMKNLLKLFRWNLNVQLRFHPPTVCPILTLL